MDNRSNALQFAVALLTYVGGPVEGSALGAAYKSNLIVLTRILQQNRNPTVNEWDSLRNAFAPPPPPVVAKVPAPQVEGLETAPVVVKTAAPVASIPAPKPAPVVAPPAPVVAKAPAPAPVLPKAQ
jgi:hypothetical protein